jgi:hypothetical protein
MTAPEDGLERALRRALAAAVSQVEPGADALKRIRARTSGRQPQPWLVSMVAGAFDRARHWVWRGHWAWPENLPKLSSLPRPRLRLLPPAGTKSVPPRHAAPARKPGRLTGLAWLRPAAVLAGVAFIASIALAVPPFRQAIVQVSSTMLTGQPSGQAGGGGGSPAGTGRRPGGASGTGSAAATTTRNGTSPGVSTTASCKPRANPTPTASPVQFVNGASNTASAAAQAPGSPGPGALPTSLPFYPGTSPSACPTPTATPTASPTQSPSLSPSPTMSGSPSVSPSTTSASPTDSSSPSQSPSQSPSPTAEPSTSPPSSPVATPSGTGAGSSGQGTLPSALTLARHRTRSAWPGCTRHWHEHHSCRRHDKSPIPGVGSSKTDREWLI